MVLLRSEPVTRGRGRRAALLALLALSACTPLRPLDDACPEGGACRDAPAARDAPAGEDGFLGADAAAASCAAPRWSDPDWLAHSGCYYVLDVRELYFNHWCWVVGACAPGALPDGVGLDDLLAEHDALTALVSLQGIVNRSRPTLYLIAEERPDADWLERLPAERIWLHEHRRTDLASVPEALALFAGHPALAGSVRWTADEPHTLNLAFALAGAEDLVVVREGSALEADLTARFPRRQDLVGRFASKRAAYEWLIDEYVASGRLAPEPVLVSDGWQVHEWTRGRFTTHLNLLLSRDVMVSRRQFGIAYGVHPRAPDPTQPIPPPPGEGREVITRALAAVRARVGPGRVFAAGGWPPDEYLFDCDGNGSADQADAVLCAEWSWAELVSASGGTLRVGGAAFGKEAANTSFFAHGPGVDLLVQPAPLTPEALLRAGHLLGPPRDFSFELEGASDWELSATNRALYRDPGMASHGERYLECNVSPADLGRGIAQTLALTLDRGQHYTFTIRARRRTGTAPRSGRQRVVAEGGTVLCEQPFTLDGPDWVTLSCGFEARRDGLVNPRLEVLLDTPGENFAFDEAYFVGARRGLVNLFRRYVLFYMGDYDLENMLAIIPVGVYPHAWDLRTAPESTVPTAWGMTAAMNEWAPPLFAYFARTHTPLQTFVMPDSGAGYLNPSFLPPEYVEDWIGQTTALFRPLGYRSGWHLDGRGGRNILGADALGARIRSIYRVIAPDGVYYADRIEGPRELLDGLPLIPLEGPPIGGGTTPADATRILAEHLRRSPSSFSAFRVVFFNEQELGVAVRGLAEAGTPITPLDPSTFLALYRQSLGEGTAHRLSVVAHDVPASLAPGERREVTIRVRNDGWDAWLSTPRAPATDCDGSGIFGRGCHQLGWAFVEGRVPATGLGRPPDAALRYARAPFPELVDPGEEVDVRLTLEAPSRPGSYVVQFDGVKEGYAWFETGGNVPWQRRVEVEAAP